MRVFMLGWEFPPFISGGLGTACFGLTRAMSELGTNVIFVLPRPVNQPSATHVQLVSPNPGSPLACPTTEVRQDEFDHVIFRTVDAALGDPYAGASEYGSAPVDPLAEAVRGTTSAVPLIAGGAPYGGDLFTEVQRYATLATEVARVESFDVVHAHDWMTFPAGLAVAGMKGVPLVVHVHSTEFDRSGVHIDQRIYDVERRGMQSAIRIIAVSHLTRNQITQMYGINPNNIDVVYNAIDIRDNNSDKSVPFDEARASIRGDEKIVLFLGRLTHQKGPEYFLAAAKKVLEVMDNVKFIIAGSGDMIRRTIETAAAMGIADKVLFTGFLRGPDVDRIFKMADLYVMPSVSEPFGIASLEAMGHDVPVIISKQSGVSEVLSHALKVDFWDVDEMANKIVAVLRHPPLANTLRERGGIEVRRMGWSDAARQCMTIYDRAISVLRS